MSDIFRPASESELQDKLRDLSASRASLRISGGGTRSTPVGIASDRMLSTSALSEIELYDPGALTLIAGAGTPMAEIEAALAAENQCLAFEPMDHRTLLGTKGEPTIGGVVAANVSGPRRLKAGACRDALLGARFVDGSGRLLKSGGRVMKNVTGLDLAKLMCGAHGTLGVLSQVGLKVLPVPERSATLVFDGLNDVAAVDLFCKALVTPFEVSGAAYVDGRAYLRLEGLTDQVGDRQTRLGAQLKAGDSDLIEGDAHRTLWTGIRDLHHFADTGGKVWRVSVKPTDAPAILDVAQNRLGAKTSLDWGGGLIWIDVPKGETAAGQVLREALRTLGGHATLVRGDATVTDHAFHPESAPLARISAGIRARFDPANILNPGLMAA